jgi:hypothetical protein
MRVDRRHLTIIGDARSGEHLSIFPTLPLPFTGGLGLYPSMPRLVIMRPEAKVLNITVYIR